MASYPIFKPVFHLYINAENSEVVSTFQDGRPGKRIFVQIHEGYCDSTDEAYPFNIKIKSGTNWLFLSPDNVLTLDVRLRAETQDGHGVYIHYTGYTKPTPAMNAVFDGSGSTMDFGETEFFIKPEIETDAVKEGWVNNKYLIGKGRFVRNAAGVMGAEYYISMCM
ncbi:uncharacterized protein V1518DRAFT_417306 [Limtongia smithiae]|uniref:uncharacterized protein n=1 Tax=Limtongia smithiae TaxID=1125753 RepID=UPI0034CE78F6